MSTAGRRCDRRYGWGRQHRRWDCLVDEGKNRLMHEVPKIATLVQAGLVDAEAVCEEAVAAPGAGGPGELALEHQAAQRQLSGVVGGLQHGVGGEAPQRRATGPARWHRCWPYDAIEVAQQVLEEHQTRERVPRKRAPHRSTNR